MTEIECPRCVVVSSFYNADEALNRAETSEVELTEARMQIGLDA